MKILFLGHYRESSGYSYASWGYINSLIAAGYDVVCRCYKLNNINPQIPDNIIECEKKSLDNIDVVIQHLLPHNMSYIPGVKNIGICVHDTSSLRYVEWDRYLNCMDEVWIPQRNHPLKKEINVPVKYVPHAFDIERYNKIQEPLDIKEINGTCIFYTIAELNIRKNFRDTLIAFHSEFHTNEPVSMLIKTGVPGMEPQESFNIVSQSISSIKNDLKLYPKDDMYKSEIVITNSLPQEEIEKIHSTCFAYVNTSRGEGWCMPQFDAWAYGNRIISYISETSEYPYLKDSHQCNFINVPTTNVFAYKETFPNLGTAREDWSDTDIPSLRIAMRKVYNEWLNNPNKIINNDYKNYSYESVGNIIKELL